MRHGHATADLIVGSLDHDGGHGVILGLHLPDDVILVDALDDVLIRFERLLHGGRQGSLVRRFGGEHETLAAGRDRQLVIRDHDGVIAQVAYQVLANVDARPVRIVANAVDRVVERSFRAFAEELVEQRAELLEGGFDLPIDASEGHHVLEIQVGGLAGTRVGEPEHAHRLFVGLGGIHGGPVQNLVFAHCPGSRSRRRPGSRQSPRCGAS